VILVLIAFIFQMNSNKYQSNLELQVSPPDQTLPFKAQETTTLESRNPNKITSDNKDELYKIKINFL
jgi:hypothetical protein